MLAERLQENDATINETCYAAIRRHSDIQHSLPTTHSPKHPLSHPLIHTPTHSKTHRPTYSPTRTPTHLPTHNLCRRE